MNRKAFTLIELLVVVAIIGILAAVGVVAYNGYTEAAKKNIIKLNHSEVKKFIQLVNTHCDIGQAMEYLIWPPGVPLSYNAPYPAGVKKSYSNCSSMLDSGIIQNHFMLSGFTNPYVTSGDIRGVWMGSNLCKNPGIVHIHKYSSKPIMFQLKTCFKDGTYIEDTFASSE